MTHSPPLSLTLFLCLANLLVGDLTGQGSSLRATKLSEFPGVVGAFAVAALHPGGHGALTIGERGDPVLWDLPEWAERKRFETKLVDAFAATLHPSEAIALVAIHNETAERGRVVALSLDDGSTSDLVTRRATALAIRHDGVIAIVTEEAKGYSLLILSSTNADPTTTRTIELPDGRPHRIYFERGSGALCGLNWKPPNWRVDIDADEPQVHSIDDVIGFSEDETPVRYSGRRLRCGSFTSSNVNWNRISVGNDGSPVSFATDDDTDNHVHTVEKNLSRAVSEASTSTAFRIRASGGGTTIYEDLGGQVIALRNRGTRIEAGVRGEFRSIGGHVGDARELTFSADGRYLAAAGSGAAVVAGPGGRVVRHFPGHAAFVSAGSGPEFLLVRGTSIQKWNAGTDIEFDRVDLADGWSIELDWGLWEFSTQELRRVARSTDERFLFARVLRGPRHFHSGVVSLRDGTVAKTPKIKGPGVSYTLMATGAVWSPADDQFVVRYGTPPESCGTAFLTTSHFGAIAELAPTTQRFSATLTTTSTTALCVTPNGQWIVESSTRGVQTRDASTLEPVTSIELSSVRWLYPLSNDLAIGHDGASMFTLTIPDLKVTALTGPWPTFDRNLGYERYSSKRHGFTAAAVSPDRRKLAVAFDARVVVCEITHD